MSGCAVMATIARMEGLDAIVVTREIADDATMTGYRDALILLPASLPVLRWPGQCR